MDFLHYKVQGESGDVVRVQLKGTAFVRFLDTLNFDYYRSGRKFSGEGGYCDKPTVDFIIPYKGTFHVVIDHNGKPGIATAVVDIYRKSKAGS